MKRKPPEQAGCAEDIPERGATEAFGAIGDRAQITGFAVLARQVNGAGGRLPPEPSAFIEFRGRKCQARGAGLRGTSTARREMPARISFLRPVVEAQTRKS
jgi:hypothetical protein